METTFTQATSVAKKLITTKNKFVMRSLFLTVAILFGIGKAWAGDTNYYAKLQTKVASTGGGLVYAGTTSSAPASSDYGTDKTSDSQNATNEAGGAKTFYAFAQANEGYSFTGWYSGDNSTGEYLGNASPLTVVVNASTSANQTNTKTIYASFAENKAVDVTFIPGTNGSYTVNGTKITSSQSIACEGTTALVATAASNYKFFGWYTSTDGGTTRSYFSYSATDSYVFQSAATVYAEFIPSTTAVFIRNGNEAVRYKSLTEALSGFTSGVVSVCQNGTVDAGSYTIPKNVTLLVPFDNIYSNELEGPTYSTSVTTAPSITEFRKLTLASNVTLNVNGNICVGANIAYRGAHASYATGEPLGACGMLEMLENSTINIANGANLYAWGYVYGAGQINVASGGAVYEMMQLKTYRGGAATEGMVIGTGSTFNPASVPAIFPFNQYYIQNVESKIVFSPGAKETILIGFNATGVNPANEKVNLIGGSSEEALFKLSSGTISKYYNPQTDRLEFEAENANVTMGAIDIYGYSSDFLTLTVTNNFTIRAKGTSSISVQYVVAVSPGAQIYVEKNATLNILNTGKLYVYDYDDWHNKGFAYSVDFQYVDCVASTSNHKPKTRTIEDAAIYLDGTLNVAGAIYSTTNGGNICSPSGTGKVVLSAVPGSPDTKTYQLNGTGQGKSSTDSNGAGDVYIGSHNMKYFWATTVPITLAKLHNANQWYSTPYTGDSKACEYLATAGSAASTTIDYKNGHWGWMEIWKDKDEKNVLQAKNTVTQQSGTAPEHPAVSGQEPDGWTTETDTENHEVVHVAKYKGAQRTITTAVIPAGTGSVTGGGKYNVGATATLTAAANDGYKFVKWNENSSTTNPFVISSVASDATYTAVFEAQQYNITYKDQGGASFSGTQTDAPTKHTYGTATTLKIPTKTGYTFGGWFTASDCASGAVGNTTSASLGETSYTADITLYAKWTANENTAYTVKHYKQQLDGTYSATPDDTDNETGTTGASVIPERKFYEGFDAPDAQTVTILADGSRVVTYYYTRKSYNLSWVTDGDALTGDYTNGSTLFGASITAPDTPTKTGYTFAAWTPAVDATMPAAATTYTATWNVVTYNLTYEGLNGASNSNPATYTVETETFALADPGTRSGYTFTGWTCGGDPITQIAIGSTGDKTITANWTANTNTAYTVKHYQQNLDGTYPSEPTDTDDETGTTDAEVTPAVKNYTGFTAPSTQTVTILADGSLVVTYQYTRNRHKLEWVFGEGGSTSSTSYTEASDKVPYGTTIVYPEASTMTRTNYGFDGWDKDVATMPDEDLTITANWVSGDFTVTWKDMRAFYDNNNIIKTESVGAGVEPKFAYEKEPDMSYRYELIGWSDAETHVRYIFPEKLPVVIKDVTYIALYNAIVRNFVVSADGYTLPQDTVADVTTVRPTGHLNIPVDKTLKTTDFVLEATPSESGELIGDVKAANVYFDLIIKDTEPRHWHAFTVPFEVNLKKAGKPIQIDGETLTLGRGYDIVYYDGAARAAHGKSPYNWVYVEDGDSTLYPGKAYMIASASRTIGTVRFTKDPTAPLHFSGTLGVEENQSEFGANDSEKVANSGWNAIGNPLTQHALIDASFSAFQVHNGEKIGSDGYTTYLKKDYKRFVVGKAVFVQVGSTGNLTIEAASNETIIPAAAPRRTISERNSDKLDVQIAQHNGKMADRIYIAIDEDKKEDKYTIGSDLAKLGLSTERAQMWVDRYGEKLCLNTMEPVNNQTYYPLGISVPSAGEYEIYLNEQPEGNVILYLTLDEKPIWNLNYGAYTANLEKGTNNRYGLRYVKKIATGFEDLTIENGEAIRKVLVDDKVYIIRNGEVYSITGQLVK